MSFLVPRAGAIVRLRTDAAEIEAGTWAATFDGRLAGDVADVARGIISPRLAALAQTNTAAAAIASWREYEWLPLTALDAVRLDGFDTLFLELVGTCNERCVHCYAESSPQVKAALARDVCEGIVDDALAAGFKRIQFTGGDPLLCRFLPELVERAKGFEVREIYTNGLLLNDELLDRLAPYEPAFAFSYYSHVPEAHDAITRTPGSQRRTLAAIERALARGLDVRVSIVVLDQNVDTIDETVARLEQIGVKLIGIAAGRAAGRGSAFAWQPKPQPAVVVASSASGATNAGNAGHRSPTGTSDGKLCVTYTGEVVPCIFNRSRVLGHVGDDSRLRDVLGALAITPGPAATEAKLSCASCRITDIALATLGAS